MKRLLSLIIILSTSLLFAQIENYEEQVLTTHNNYYKSLVVEGSAAALEHFYADDFTYIGVDGKIIDKKGLKSRMSKNKLGHFTIEDDIRRLSIHHNIAIVSGHSTSSITDKGVKKITQEGYTEVWEKRKGEWKLIMEQITMQKPKQEVDRNDKNKIEVIIQTIAQGWKERDVEKTVQHYDDKLDWTNAFGDRMQSKADLKALLTEIYSFDFVMKGKSESQYKDINFLTSEIAVVRSKTVVKGQEWSNGTAMKDRHNHHLMVFQKKNEEWKVISHLISQAWAKK